jgi:hypothetical protein
MRCGIARIARCSLLQEVQRQLMVSRCELEKMPQAPVIEFPRSQALRCLVERAAALGVRHRRLNRRQNGLGDLVLNRENIRQIVIVAFGPEVVAGFCVRELDANANPSSAAADAALYNVTDS